MAGWKTDRPDLVGIQESALRLVGPKTWALTRMSYDDFVLELEVRTSPGARGGLLLRTSPNSDIPSGGYELTIANGGDWHRVRVECRQKLLQAWMDDRPIANVNGLQHDVGRIALVAHEGSVAFRKLELTRLDRKPANRPQSDRIVYPRVLRKVRPQYTARAKKAKIHGTVRLDAVVLPDGTVGDVSVSQSLAPDLDQQAITAAKQWRFLPGTRDGRPVSFLVTIELTFTLKDD